MQFVATLLNNLAYLNPLTVAGWMVWLGLAGLRVVLLSYWRQFQPAWSPQNWGIFAALLIAAPFASLFTDPIADMLTRIRHGQAAGKKIVKQPSSNSKSRSRKC